MRCIVVVLSNKTKNRLIKAMAREEEAKELISAIEDGSGVPDGGTPGQVLAKLSSADGDADWQDLSGVSVSSVNGQTGAVTLSKTDIGLSNVDNISDANKPISNATQTALNSKQNSITGSNGRLIYKDASGVVKSLQEVQVDISSGFEQLDIVRNLDDNASSFDIYRVNLSLEPLQSSPDESWNLFNNQISLDTALSGLDMGTTGPAFRFTINSINHAGTSDVGNIEFIQNNLNLGNGTDSIDVKGFSYLLGFGTVNANVHISNAIQGYGFQPNINAAASISTSTYIQAFYDSSNIGCTSPNYTSFNASPNINSIANSNNYSGLVVNPTILNFNGNAGATGLGIYGNWGAFGTSGGFKGLAISPVMTNAHYAEGINVDMTNVGTYPGVASSLIIQDLTISFNAAGDNNAFQIRYVDDTTAGSETAALSGQLITVHIESGVSTATQIKAALEANLAFAGALSVVISGVGSNTQVAQAATNFINGVQPGYKKAAYLNGDVEITGSLTFGGALSIGQLNAFSSLALVNTGGNPQSIHSLISQPTVAANAVLTSADTLGVNTAALITIGDNASVATAFLGIAALGLPAVLSMGVGATVDKIYGALFALSLDASATGGTVDEVGLCKAVAMPNGVTTVNNLYGFLFDLPFGQIATNTWGFYSRTTNHNYFGGDLLIGGTPISDDIVSNTSVALEIKSTTKAFRNAVMTSTQRDALTPLSGMQIYNSSTNKLQVYSAGSWVDLH